MTTKVVALAGANGYVGKAITNALLDANAYKLRILTRTSSLDSAPLQAFKGRGASLHGISYADHESLVKALQGVDVLISTVGAEALVPAQIPLIRAAKAAGVKLFIPSEFGVPFDDDSTSPLVRDKRATLEAAKSEGQPLAIIYNGGFPEYCFIPPIGFDFAERKVTIWGHGNTKVCWTTVASVGSWLAGVLKTRPIEELQGKEFYITAEVTTLNEVVKLWEKKHSEKLQVEYRPVKELDDRIAADANDFLAVLIKAWATGAVHFEEKDNKLYPDWKPDTVESIL